MKSDQFSLKEVFMVPKHFFHQLKGVLSRDQVSELERVNKEGQNDTKEEEKQEDVIENSLNDVTLSPMPLAPGETEKSILPPISPSPKAPMLTHPSSPEEKFATTSQPDFGQVY